MGRKFKIIDFERKGNQVKFYLGNIDNNDYWGDDWDDAPYEHNAGSVYKDNVVGTFVKVFGFDDVVVEPASGIYNSIYSKDDMKKSNVPCICVVKEQFLDKSGWKIIDTMAEALANKNAIKYYFNDVVDEDNENIVFC